MGSPLIISFELVYQEATEPPAKKLKPSLAPNLRRHGLASMLTCCAAPAAGVQARAVDPSQQKSPLRASQTRSDFSHPP